VPNGFGVNIVGSEETSIKENHIETGLAGIVMSDDKALVFPDDGPIKLGSVEGNIIEGGIAGIYSYGPTTVSDAEIKDNVVSGALWGILLDTGANGFKITSNEFSGNVVADIWLGFDEDGDLIAFPPDTHDNYVEARDGDLVFDFGVDNEVVIKD
jgi:nitrous oxidase accessory protein NosD